VPVKEKSMAEVRASEMKAVETAFRRFSLRAQPTEILQETSKQFFYQPDRKKYRARPRTDEAATAATSLACLTQTVTSPDSRPGNHHASGH
jgi:ribosomal protein S21